MPSSGGAGTDPALCALITPESAPGAQTLSADDRLGHDLLPRHRRALTRDLYIPAGDIGLWQGALRDETDALRQEIASAVSARDPITVELMYTDQVGGQRTITRFGLTPVGDEGWLSSVTRHWYLDGGGPR